MSLVPIKTMGGAQAFSEAVHVVNIGAGVEERVEEAADEGVGEGKN